jgi:hypothetical protein
MSLLPTHTNRRLSAPWTTPVIGRPRPKETASATTAALRVTVRANRGMSVRLRVGVLASPCTLAVLRAHFRLTLPG